MLYRFIFQDESVAPYTSFPAQKVSFDQGFNLTLVFLRYLYDKRPVLYSSDSKEIAKLNFNLMAGRFELTGVWNQVVCQATSSSQKTNSIRTENLFSCLIEFIKFFNEGCNFELKPLIALLEEININPSEYPAENSLWKCVISNGHKRLVFSYAACSTEKELSVEHGFNIAMLFFEDLMLLIMPMLGSSLDRWLPYNHALLDGHQYPAEWNEAVFRATNIPKPQQRKTIIPIEVLFSCLIEFSKIMHARFNFELDYLLDLLEAIQENPRGFPIETKLWEKVIKNSYSVRSLWREFYWDSLLPEYLTSEEIDTRRQARVIKRQVSNSQERPKLSTLPIKEIYQKKLPDGGWSWTEVVKGKVINSGRHEVEWEFYNKTCPEGRGKLYQPDVVHQKELVNKNGLKKGS